MKFTKPAAIVLSCLCLHAGVALADDTSPPKATATRPAKEPPGQTSMPSNAPPATRIQPTESADQKSYRQTDERGSEEKTGDRGQSRSEVLPSNR